MFGFHRVTKQYSDKTTTSLIAAYPTYLAEDVKTACAIVPLAGYELHVNIDPVKLDGELLRIPSRVYFPEPPLQSLNNLSNTQKAIIATLYTTHHDGFVRERWVEKVIGEPHSWVAPYVLQLLGEYVIEIMYALSRRADALKEAHYQTFMQENPDFCVMICKHIVSYWDCYFRRWSSPRFTDHVAYRVAKKIGLWRDNIAPRLTRIKSQQSIF